VTEIGFAPKEIIPQEVCRLEVMAADKADTYGPQIYLKLKVVGGDHDGHQFNDYANRDEDTGQIKQGSKAWAIFEACLGHDFHKRQGVSLESLVGKQFVGQVTQTPERFDKGYKHVFAAGYPHRGSHASYPVFGIGFPGGV
jgi:hypothetical protein